METLIALSSKEFVLYAASVFLCGIMFGIGISLICNSYRTKLMANKS